MRAGGTSAAKEVKGHLLPLTRFERTLEWLTELLPRRKLQIALKPSRQIEILNVQRGEFKSTGSEPAFKLEIESDLRNGAWLYVEAALIRNNGSRVSYLKFESEGAGWKEILIPIPTNLRGTVREVVYSPPRSQAIYWLPTASPGFFSHKALVVHEITWIEGVLRRMHRVIYDLWRFRHRPHAVLQGLTWLRAITNLSEAYRSTALLRMKRLVGNDYDSFIAVNEASDNKNAKNLLKATLKLASNPLISIILVMQEGNPRHFQETIESILAQGYRHWELILVGDLSSQDKYVIAAKEKAQSDSRIKIVHAISESSVANKLNVALAVIQGEFFVRVNPSDCLAHQALLLVVQELVASRSADLVYTDHDYLDNDRSRCMPCFKPDWNPDLFSSHNYIGTFAFYRTQYVLDRGGYSAEVEHAENYDLTLRYTRDLPSGNIRHVSRILYHVRLSLQSERNNLNDEDLRDSLIHNAETKALMSYFDGTGVIVEDGATKRVHKIRYPLPVQRPLVSIIVPTRDRVDILQKCVESIFTKTDYENWELLVIDNCSVESSTLHYLKQLQTDKRVKVLQYHAPFNYSALNNYAAEHASGEVFALLNNDVEAISSSWLSEMVSHALRPGVGAIGAKLLYANQTIQHAGVILGIGGVAGHAHKYLAGDANGYFFRAVCTQNYSAVTGACLIVTKKCFEEVGGLNELDLAVAFNDIEFCLKLVSKGYRNVFTPYALLYHHESISRGNNDTKEKQIVFEKEFSYMQKTWGRSLLDDPAYNRNLTREFEDFSLRS